MHRLSEDITSSRNEVGPRCNPAGRQSGWKKHREPGKAQEVYRTRLLRANLPYRFGTALAIASEGKGSHQKDRPGLRPAIKVAREPGAIARQAPLNRFAADRDKGSLSIRRCDTFFRNELSTVNFCLRDIGEEFSSLGQKPKLHERQRITPILGVLACQTGFKRPLRMNQGQWLETLLRLKNKGRFMPEIGQFPRKDGLPENWVEILKSEYPHRCGQGWTPAQKQVSRRVAEGHSWTEILSGTRDYRSYCDREELTGSSYVLMAKTFFGPDCWFKEDWRPQAKPKLPQQVALERRWNDLKERAETIEFRQPTEIELSVDPSVFEQHLKEYEKRVRPN